MTDAPTLPARTAAPVLASPGAAAGGADGAASELPAAERATAWIAYGCFALGLFLDWPSLIGLLLSYARRSAPGTGAVRSHYTGLIEMFWTALAIGVASAVLLATGLWPALREAMAGGVGIDPLRELSATTLADWLSFRTPLSLAALGALGIVGAYLFVAYRLIRGARRLAAGRPAD
jgi:uncharacterized membrane protein